MIRQSIENLGPGKDVEAYQNDVVREQHKSSEFISKSSLSKGIVSEITYCPATIISLRLTSRGRDPPKDRKGRLTDISDLRVLHDEFVHSNGSDPEKDTGEDHGNNTRTPS